MRRLPSSVVADASLAIKWVLAEHDSAKARMVGINRTLFAPEFLLVECANILWKHQQRGDVSRDEGTAAFVALQAAPFLWTRDAELVGDARRLSGDLSHPVYDCLYLALAMRNGAPMVTADRRFASLVATFGTLAEYVIALDSLD